MTTSQVKNLRELRVPKPPGWGTRPTAPGHDYFGDCQDAEPLSEELGAEAEKPASRYGLSGSDALHIASAIRQQAAEFYTSERPGRPMFRVRELKVISLFSLLQ